MSTSGAADREPGSDRKGGGRSRTGCAACKKRRRKCDEAKPSCNSCSLAGRVCTYPPPVPLRERRDVQHGRALPGQQTPWHLPVTAPNTPPNLKALMPLSPSIGQPLDPFDALPLSMPKKSLALFHYCKSAPAYREIYGQIRLYRIDPDASANDVHFSRPPFTAQNLLAYASQDGDILRNILFVASWHYLWNTGSLHDFATTYHVHKVESLQKVREWVDDASSRKNALKAVRAIATHCIVEISMGNFREAETHLKGLMTLTEVLGLGARSPKDLEGELMNRYVVVIINFMQGLRTRALDSHRIEESHISSTIRRGYVEEKPGLAMRLAAVLRVPYFFIANTNGSLPPPVNARYVLDSFGDITKDVGERLRVSSRARRNEIWNTGTSGVAFAAILESHMASIASNWTTEPREDPEKPKLEAQWTPLVAATGLYFGIFLMLWDPGVVADCRIRRYLSLTIRQYVLSSRRKLSTWDDEHRCLWFWMAFLVALCNVIAPENERDAEWATMGTEMRMCIYDWSCLVHITTWPDARAALVSMSWPTYLHLEAESASVWEASVSENQIPYRERPQ